MKLGYKLGYGMGYENVAFMRCAGLCGIRL